MASSDFTIAFHIGAHKTATSHLQRSLEVQVDALAEVGVQFYGPKHFRLPGRSIQRLFGLKPGKAGEAPRRSPIDQLALLRKGADRMVLSEENYIGVLNSPRRRVVKLRYPHAARRVAELSQVMGVDGIDVFLCVRHPIGYLNSAYSQLLLGGKVMPIDRFQRINPIESVNWLSLVKRLRRAKGVNQLIVWRHEDYAAVFDQIGAGLVGPAAAHLVTPIDRRIHVGLSGKAVADVLARRGKRDVTGAANEARRLWPVNDTQPAFDGFDAAQHAEADQAYQTQIAAIAAISGVMVLRP